MWRQLDTSERLFSKRFGPGQNFCYGNQKPPELSGVLFDSSKELGNLYPKFLRHAITSFQSPDVMRFLGRRVPQSGAKVHGKFEGEVTSSLKGRAEGVRIRHTLNGKLSANPS
jgi:hypothetical protein